MCLRALHTYVPYVPSYLKLLRAYVPARLRTLNYDVPMCMRALIFHDLIYAYVPIYIFRAYEPLCLKLFRAYMRSFFACLRAYNHSQNILWPTSIPRIVVFLWIIWLFKTQKQRPAYKTAYSNPILCGFAISTGACTETIIWRRIKKLSKTMDSF